MTESLITSSNNCEKTPFLKNSRWLIASVCFAVFSTLWTPSPAKADMLDLTNPASPLHPLNPLNPINLAPENNKSISLVVCRGSKKGCEINNSFKVNARNSSRFWRGLYKLIEVKILEVKPGIIPEELQNSLWNTFNVRVTEMQVFLSNGETEYNIWALNPNKMSELNSMRASEKTTILSYICILTGVLLISLSRPLLSKRS